MTAKKYNKLVRDLIPDIIKKSGQTANTYVLNQDDYIKELDNKLTEEYEEYMDDQNVEELADIVEVIYAIVKSKGVTLDEFEEIRTRKVKKRGAFDNRVYLEGVHE